MPHIPTLQPSGNDSNDCSKEQKTPGSHQVQTVTKKKVGQNSQRGLPQPPYPKLPLHPHSQLACPVILHPAPSLLALGSHMHHDLKALSFSSAPSPRKPLEHLIPFCHLLHGRFHRMQASLQRNSLIPLWFSFPTLSEDGNEDCNLRKYLGRRLGKPVLFILPP